MTVDDSDELVRVKRALAEAQQTANELAPVRRELVEAQKELGALEQLKRELAEAQEEAKELARVKGELADVKREMAEDKEFYGATVYQHLVLKRMVTDAQIAMVEADVPTKQKRESEVVFWVRTGGSDGALGTG